VLNTYNGFHRFCHGKLRSLIHSIHLCGAACRSTQGSM
jgi:hypothetical protein